MDKAKEKIAELVSILPMFIGILLEGSEIKTPIKLNVSEERTLMVLYKHEGNPMVEYSKKVGLTKGSFTSVADLLEKKGLIERVAVYADRRKLALMLTKEGKTIAKKIDFDFKENILKKIAQLEKEDIINLKNALEDIASIMEKLKERKKERKKGMKPS